MNYLQLCRYIITLVFLFVFIILVIICGMHRATYSPGLYDNKQYVWPNMSRRRLRSNYGEPCGDLLSSSSSHTTETSLVHDARANIGELHLQHAILESNIVSCRQD